jgi:microcompartment protein CcmL/EutN
MNSTKQLNVLAALEFSSIAKGFLALDEMIKTAPVKIIEARTVSRGKYLIVFSGDLASVEYAFHKGKDIAKDFILDSLILPMAHPQVIEAIGKIVEPEGWDSVGIIETETLTSGIRAADIAAKESPVNIVEIRLANGYGGKSYVKLTGLVEDVQASVSAACSMVKDLDLLVTETIIAQPHAESKEFFIKKSEY